MKPIRPLPKVAKRPGLLERAIAAYDVLGEGWVLVRCKCLSSGDTVHYLSKARLVDGRLPRTALFLSEDISIGYRRPTKGEIVRLIAQR